MSKKHLHIRRTNIRQVLIVCVLLLGLCAAFAVFSTVKLQSNATDIVRRYADAFISRLSSELENNNSAMESTVLTTSYRSVFEQTGMEWVEQSGSLQNTYQLLNKLSINRYNYYVYENHQDRFLELTAVTLPFSEYRQIRGELKRLSKEPVVSGRYVLHEMPGGRRVILCMWVNDSFVCGAWITEEDFLSGLVHYSDNNIAEFSLLKYGEMGQSSREKRVTYELTDVYADFCIQMQIDSDRDIMWVLLFQVVQMLLLMIGMVILLLSVSAVRKNLLEPIQNLTGILSKYSKNTTSYKDVNGAVINALDDTYDVLSQLSDQMEALSVRLYEAELEKRQLNINFRNLQIRPHFLVNNLTTIYDMAQLGQTDKIMNLTVALSNYYRYVLRDCMDMVPLWQELRHMDSIIRINQEWNGNSVHVEYSIAEDVRSILIPVLLVSTFLENSLKHAANSEHGLNITVSGACRQEGEKPFLFLRLRDDGGGYPQELLDYLQSGKLIPEVDGKHIGINNAIQRIRLIYGDAAKITLSNHSDGAQVEIWIPM